MKIAAEDSGRSYIHKPGFERMECTNEFQVRFGHNHDRTVAYCRGRLVYGASVVALRYAILWSPHLLLDFREVRDIDAAGLGMLAQLQVLATVMGASFAFCNVNAQIRQLLRISRLDSVLCVTEDERGDLLRAAGA